MAGKRTIKKSLQAFVSSWGHSITSRLRAARIYADAANAGNTEAKAQFWALDGFKHWTAQQWSLLYWIGSGVLSPKFIDSKDLSVPLAFAYKNVRMEMQNMIFDHGLKIANINGTLREIEFKKIHQQHISQAFKDNGEERTIEEQVQWLKDKERKNVEVLENGNIRIRHACILTPTDLFELLCSNPPPLGVEALIAAANRQARRANHEQS